MQLLLRSYNSAVLTRSLGALALVVTLSSSAFAQTVPVRNYNVNRTSAAPVADGVISPGEWNAAATAAGSWGVLREGPTDMDTENNRFRMMWDSTALYVLYETDFNQWVADADINDPTTGMSFGIDNLNLYFDPNEDNEPNFVTEPEGNVDGYQLAWTQPKGPGGVATISTAADHDGVGFFTEAHHNTPFGDQARWNTAGSDVAGGGLGTIKVAQKNGATGGVAEAVIPWADFDALERVADPANVNASDFNGDGAVDGHDFLIWQKNPGASTVTNNSTGDADLSGVIDGADLDLWKAAYGAVAQLETGLNATEGVVNGDVWFFEMGRINGLGDQGNFLPIWNWKPGNPFAERPHGTLTFVTPAGAAIPEPATVSLVAMSLIALGGLSRRGKCRRGN